MECVLQWLDDLDDGVAAVLLLARRAMRTLLTWLATLAALSLPAAGIWLALSHPPLALAAASLLFVAQLYHQVTAPLEIAA